jgi:argininosuccinate synthase
MKKRKIVVAYSGGLDTSVMVRWLKEKYDAEIITATGNLGQEKELIGVREKALKTGAAKAYISDLTPEFIREYCFPALRAGALYEGAYPLATALGRPLLAKMLVEVARKERADMIAHGCSGKGNDQVRFEVSIGALAPECTVLAPLRDWEFKSREEEIAYAKAHKIPVAATKASPYSIDENIWGTSIECGALEDPETEPPPDAYQRTVAPEAAPDRPEYVTIGFKKGVPVSLNGGESGPAALLRSLNKTAGAHGIGRIDLVENRLVGIKSREIYEAPAAAVLHFAHSELERLTLDKAVSDLKAELAQKYANLVYNGLWYSPLRNALDAFVDETQARVTGSVKVKMFKGALTVAGRSSPHSLYQPALATYTEEDQFDHRASEGFVKIFGLPLKTYHKTGPAPDDKSGRNGRRTHAESNIPA